MSLQERKGPYKPYKPREFATEQKQVVEKETDIIDERFAFDVTTVAYIRRFRLSPNVQAVLSIPVAFNRERKVFELIEAPSRVESLTKARFHGAALPNLTEPGYYDVAIDNRARLVVNITEFLGRTVAPAVDAANRTVVNVEQWLGLTSPPALDADRRTVVNPFTRGAIPSWTYGAETTAPAAGTALVSRSVSAGKTGYVYGFFISSSEANTYRISWTSGATTVSIRIVHGAGTVHYADFVALNEGLPADGGTTITIANVNAGGADSVYQAGLLFAEV